MSSVATTTSGNTPLDPRARGEALNTFLTFVTDGKLTTQSTFRVNVTPPLSNGVTGSFLLGSRPAGSAANVITTLSAYELGVPGPSVPVRQEYIEFTLYGLDAEITRSDLRLYANGRLLSLRYAPLVKIGEDAASDSKTYRLLGVSHLTSASARYIFTIEGAAGWLSTTWDLP